MLCFEQWNPVSTHLQEQEDGCLDLWSSPASNWNAYFRIHKHSINESTKRLFVSILHFLFEVFEQCSNVQSSGHVLHNFFLQVYLTN